MVQQVLVVYCDLGKNVVSIGLMRSQYIIPVPLSACSHPRVNWCMKVGRSSHPCHCDDSSAMIQIIGCKTCNNEGACRSAFLGLHPRLGLSLLRGPPFFLRTSAEAAISFLSFTVLGKELLPREPWVVLALEGLIASSASNKSSVTTAATATDSPKVDLLVYLETSSSRPTTVSKPEVDPATEPAELEGDCLLKGMESPRMPI